MQRRLRPGWLSGVGQQDGRPGRNCPVAVGLQASVPLEPIGLPVFFLEGAEDVEEHGDIQGCAG